MASEKDDNEDEFEISYEDIDEATVEVIDDTPEEDRGREPLPKEIVDELEADELDEYSGKVKTKLKQLKKVWHDERREKERVLRENAEGTTYTQRLLAENKALKDSLSRGDNALKSSITSAVELEAAAARAEYKEAYELGDTDKVLAAQEKLSDANYRLAQVKNYRQPLQDDEPVASTEDQVEIPRPDAKTAAWQERNTWYGTDEEMTANALGLHQKLVKQHGTSFVGTDNYWRDVDSTMRRRFPEYFGPAAKTPRRQEGRPATVVAPASRSTSSRRIVLTKSQEALIKRLGVTPEQYARELIKTAG